MKKMLAVFLIVMSAGAFAGEVASVKVKGMVCSYCSSGVKKKFSEYKEVQTVEVNMDENLVKLTFKDNQNLDDKVITEIITASGFNVAEITR